MQNIEVEIRSFITKEEYDIIEPNPNASTKDGGTPWAYTIWKNCILLTDIPDQSNKWYIELNTGGEITILSDDTDEPIFSDAWDECIVAGVLSRAFTMMDLYQKAEFWKDRYVNGFTGDNGQIVGGLKLLRLMEQDVMDAPLITNFNKV